MDILAISGSLRAGSFNTALLRAAAELTLSNVTIELYHGLDRLPHYNEDHDTDTPSLEVARLREEVAAAHGLLIATPEFNGTLPGHLKQAIDWASRPYGHGSSLWGKPAAVIGASVTDYGAVWAQDHLRKALGVAGARVIGAELAVPRAPGKFDAAGRLADPEIRARLAEIVSALAEAVEADLARAA